MKRFFLEVFFLSRFFFFTTKGFHVFSFSAIVDAVTRTKTAESLFQLPQPLGEARERSA